MHCWHTTQVATWHFQLQKGEPRMIVRVVHTLFLSWSSMRGANAYSLTRIFYLLLSNKSQRLESTSREISKITISISNVRICQKIFQYNKKTKSLKKICRWIGDDKMHGKVWWIKITKIMKNDEDVRKEVVRARADNPVVKGRPEKLSEQNCRRIK